MSRRYRFPIIIVLIFLLIGCQQTPVTETSAPQIQVTSSIIPSVVPIEPTQTTVIQPTETNSLSPEPSLVDELTGLPFDDFLIQSYGILLMRDPELITEMGLSAQYGMSDDQLTDISDAFLQETTEIAGEILMLLESYPRDEFDFNQIVSYDTYHWYLSDLIEGEAYILYEYPITHFITGEQFQLLSFFTDIHPLETSDNVEDYLARLEQVDTRIDQIIDKLEARKNAGIVAPRFIFEWSIGDIRGMANSIPTLTPYYRTLESKTQDIPIDEDTREQFLTEAEQIIDKSVVPAYGRLYQMLNDLIQIAPVDDGMWQFEGGLEYYDYTLSHQTTTNLSAEEIHQIGLDELDRIHAQMGEIFKELGYPDDESLETSYARVVAESGIIQGQAAVDYYESLLSAAASRVEVAFDLSPRAELVVIGGPMGNYYVPGAIDGSRPGAFYANTSGQQQKFALATIGYHEGVPGHHFQISIAQELDHLPPFQRGTWFNAYAEGWALYAEQLMWELGAYENDPYGNLGRLQWEAFRAARLVVDTGIHAKKWTFDEAVTFMSENTGQTKQQVTFEISRYIAWPGQATSYKIGMLRILALRDKAQNELGDRYSLSEFHNAVLGQGSLPLETLEEVIDRYIQTKLEQ